MIWHLIAAAAAVIGDAPAAVEVPQVPAVLASDLPAIETLDLQTERYRRLTVPVTIGEHGPFRFMIDTGAQATVVSRELADQLQLFDREPATLIGMASVRQIETTAISDFTLGTRSFQI